MSRIVKCKLCKMFDAPAGEKYCSVECEIKASFKTPKIKKAKK